MDKHFGRIPPLSALSGFEAAARLGSFSRAAEELNITQSAISHQIKSLEDFFAQPLFQRVGRIVQLTDAGEDFLETAGKSLELLARGTRQLDSYQKPNSVIVTTSPAFANKWLIPRFSQLQIAEPELQPWLDTTNQQVNLEHAELEIAIWRGNGEWPGLKTIKLFDDYLAPVCSPVYISDHSVEASDLSGCNLLHDERREDWNSWFQHIGQDRANIIEGFNFSDSGSSIDSAIAGQGVALGSLVLAEDQLRNGSLVRPFQQIMKAEESYYMVCVELHLRRPAVQSMWDWLVEQSFHTREQLESTVGILDEHNQQP